MPHLAVAPPLLLAFLDIGPGEMIVLAIVALLLFGKKLPEVGRTLGKGMAEFKRGMMGLAMDDEAAPTRRLPSLRTFQQDEEVDDYVAPSAPKFEPPAAEPEVPEPGSNPQSDVARK